MKCLDCPNMACKVFYSHTEIWEGFCMNPDSPNSHKMVTGNSSCESDNNINRHGLFD